MSRALYVDWENVWIALRCRGFSIEPSDLLCALLRASFSEPLQGVRVVVAANYFFPTTVESRLMTAAVTDLTGAQPIIERVRGSLDKNNVADTRLAFRVGQAIERGDLTELAIASSDSDLANLAGVAASETASATVSLTYVLRRGHRPPRAEGVKLVDLFSVSDSGLPAPVHTFRDATRQDEAAWALARAWTGHRRDAEARVLHTVKGDPPANPPRWWLPRNEIGDLTALCDVDHVWWTVQRLHEQRLMVTPAEAVEPLKARLTGSLPALAGSIVQALVTVDLLRVDAEGQLRYRPTTREGLVMPLRRALLAVALTPTLHTRQLRNKHINWRYPGVTHDEASEAWSRVLSAMTTWRIAGSRQRGDYTFLSLDEEHPLWQDTRVKTCAIQAAAGEASWTTDELREAVGPWVTGRWLRTLWNLQILDYDGDTGRYSRGPRALSPCE